MGLGFFCPRCRAGRVGYQLKAKELTMLIREVRLGVAMSNTQKCTEGRKGGGKESQSNTEGVDGDGDGDMEIGIWMCGKGMEKREKEEMMELRLIKKRVPGQLSFLFFFDQRQSEKE